MTIALEARAHGLYTDVDDWISLRPHALGDRWRVYARLRAEAPLYRYHHHQFFSTYADCSEVLLDNARFENGFDPDGPSARRTMDALDDSQRLQYRAIMDHQLRWLTSSNGEKHRRLRGLAARVFSPHAIGEMQVRIQEEIDRRLDELADNGVIEIIHDFAYQLPLTIISEMLDIPSEVRESIHVAWLSLTKLIGNPPERVPGNLAAAYTGMLELESRLRHVMDLRRGGKTTDLLTRLLAAQEDENGAISSDDIIGVVTQLVIAGHQTTQDTIGNGLYSLFSDREQWELLCADPALVANTVEEILRHFTPGQMISRVPVMDTEIGGHGVRAGSTVTCLLGSANRDEAMFVNADRFDIQRVNAKQHLGFSRGAHFCLGAALSRMEVACFLKTFTRRFPDAELACASVEWVPNTFLLGLKALPVRLGKDRG